MNKVTQLGNWTAHKYPFLHYRATNVLNKESYDRITASFNSFLNATYNNNGGNAKYKLQKSAQNYDALILGMNDEIAPMFYPFFSENFLKLLANFVSIPFIPRIEGGLHSSPPNSRTGWIHTDFCSAYFDESVPVSGLFPKREGCEYFSGVKKNPAAKPVEYVRMATLIYFLCNNNWQNGYGGETGLYGAAKQTYNTSFDLIPPVNNSLLLFKCSPHSYHRFVTNPGITRNSIILWLHSPVNYAESIWGKSINHI
jgi:hypothetical protein